MKRLKNFKQFEEVEINDIRDAWKQPVNVEEVEGETPIDYDKIKIIIDKITPDLKEMEEHLRNYDCRSEKYLYLDVKQFIDVTLETLKNLSEK